MVLVARKSWIEEVVELKDLLEEKFKGKIEIDEAFLAGGVIVGKYLDAKHEESGEMADFSIIYDPGKFLEFASLKEVKKYSYELQKYLSEFMGENPYCSYQISMAAAEFKGAHDSYICEWRMIDKGAYEAKIIDGSAFPKGAVIINLAIHKTEFDQETGKIKKKTYHPASHIKERRTIEK